MLEQDLPATSLLHLRKKEIKPPDSMTDSGLHGQFWEVLVVVKCKEGNIKTNRNRENWQKHKLQIYKGKRRQIKTTNNLKEWQNQRRPDTCREKEVK